ERLECMKYRQGYFTMNDFIPKTIDLVDKPCKNEFIMILTQLSEISSDCKLECKPNCRFNSFDLFTHIEDKNSLLNVSRFILFPSEKPFIKYIYTPKMDINQLVYNLGGIIALWFGLSVYSIITKLLKIVHSRINDKWMKVILKSCQKRRRGNERL